MCQIGATCLPVECSFSELALENPTKHFGLVQRGHRHHRHDIAEKLFIWP